MRHYFISSHGLSILFVFVEYWESVSYVYLKNNLFFRKEVGLLAHVQIWGRIRHMLSLTVCIELRMQKKENTERSIYSKGLVLGGVFHKLLLLLGRYSRV